ncbi:MAG: histidine phosphatase family protein [Hyphomicrobium sp.]|jgi:phosphohistidine phosphatase|nr:histidine phosphatase family protein [Hyphomicrobium sp.]
MLTLALLRHAKSDWEVEGIPDFDRGLAPRGLAAAPAIGAEIARLGFAPDLVLCSTAKRARMTLDLVARPMKLPSKAVRHEDELYMASARQLLDRIRQIPDDAKSAMIVGHNPGFHELNVALIGDLAAEAERAAKSKFPTCTFAVYTFDTDHWRDVGPRRGRVVHFVTPRRLSEPT